MTEEEIEEYIDISVSISKVYSQRGNDGWLEFELAGEALLRKRANILKHATHKIGKVREIIQAMPLKSYLLVYAAEGEGPVTEVRQDDQLLELLRDEGLTAYEYDGGTPAQAREYLERQLDDGGIDALVAMRCLDQGVDIPEARAALFVASTTNQRQYIQRRGRILRKPKRPNSDKDHADLYDFIVVPPAPEPERFELERKLVGNEVRRARTLARSAENHLQALNVLSPLLERYGLLDQEL
jgi:superfamily II DNA or RNA helicase